jgi:acetyl esterase/lipase
MQRHGLPCVPGRAWCRPAQRGLRSEAVRALLPSKPTNRNSAFALVTNMSQCVSSVVTGDTRRCSPTRYAGSLAISDPMISPLAADATHLARLPPTMLVVGANEQLLGETLLFAQKAQSAGAPVQVEVYLGMWHDFEEESLGCGSAGGQLAPGAAAIDAVGAFFREREVTTVSCTRSGGGDKTKCLGEVAAAVRWHMDYLAHPPPTDAECDEPA